MQNNYTERYLNFENDLTNPNETLRRDNLGYPILTIDPLDIDRIRLNDESSEANIEPTDINLIIDSITLFSTNPDIQNYLPLRIQINNKILEFNDPTARTLSRVKLFNSSRLQPFSRSRILTNHSYNDETNIISRMADNGTLEQILNVTEFKGKIYITAQFNTSNHLYTYNIETGDVGESVLNFEPLQFRRNNDIFFIIGSKGGNYLLYDPITKTEFEDVDLLPDLVDTFDNYIITLNADANMAILVAPTFDDLPFSTVYEQVAIIDKTPYGVSFFGSNKVAIVHEEDDDGNNLTIGRLNFRDGFVSNESYLVDGLLNETECILVLNGNLNDYNSLTQLVVNTDDNELIINYFKSEEGDFINTLSEVRPLTSYRPIRYLDTFYWVGDNNETLSFNTLTGTFDNLKFIVNRLVTPFPRTLNDIYIGAESMLLFGINNSGDEIYENPITRFANTRTVDQITSLTYNYTERTFWLSTVPERYTLKILLPEQVDGNNLEIFKYSIQARLRYSRDKVEHNRVRRYDTDLDKVYDIERGEMGRGLRTRMRFKRWTRKINMRTTFGFVPNSNAKSLLDIYKG